MKTLGSYIILMGMFYQLSMFLRFSRNIYLPINNMIIKIHLIMLLIPSMVQIITCYFEFINRSWLLICK